MTSHDLESVAMALWRGLAFNPRVALAPATTTSGVPASLSTVISYTLNFGGVPTVYFCRYSSILSPLDTGAVGIGASGTGTAPVEDQSAVALIQAKATYEIAKIHMTALETAGKKDQLKAAKGQLYSAQGKFEGATAQLSYIEVEAQGRQSHREQHNRDLHTEVFQLPGDEFGASDQRQRKESKQEPRKGDSQRAAVGRRLPAFHHPQQQHRRREQSYARKLCDHAAFSGRQDRSGRAFQYRCRVGEWIPLFHIFHPGFAGGWIERDRQRRTAQLLHGQKHHGAPGVHHRKPARGEGSGGRSSVGQPRHIRSCARERALRRQF